MNSAIIRKNIAFYPECFSMNQYKYKRFTDKINKLNKDLELFIENNKNKMNKPKKKFNRLGINRLFRKLVFDSTNKVLKNYENNDKKANKRFFSAKEIQKYKDSKIMFLKLIRTKNMNNSKTKNFTIDKIYINKNRSILNNPANFIIYNRNSNKKNNNNTSQIKNKSFYSQLSVRHNLYNPKVEKNKRKINFKLKVSGDKYINKSSIENQHNYDNIRYDKDLIKNNDNEILIKSYNDNSLNNNSKNNNYFIDNYDNSNYKLFKQKLNLKKLEFKVHKFENSSKYFPDNDSIYKNIKPNKFINKKYIRNNKLDKSFIHINKFNKIFNKFKKRNIFSAPRIFPKLNKSLISSLKENTNSNRTINIMNKNNTTILFQTINDIQKKIKIKKKIIKNEKKRKNNYVTKIMNYFKNKKYSNKDIDKDLKRDFVEYQNKMGHFIKIDDKYLYTSHISLILDNRRNILKNVSHSKSIW